MVIDHQAIPIATEVDIINARILVRQAARRLGMKLIDQSRISLATSSLADAVGLGTGRSAGQINIDTIIRNSDNSNGLQVVCIYHPYLTDDHIAPPVANLRWMVDECQVRDLMDNQTQITLIKWLV